MTRFGVKNIDYTAIDQMLIAYTNSLLASNDNTLIRHLYYKAIGINPVSYQCIDKHITKLRENGIIDDSVLVDTSRKRHDLEAQSFTNVDSFLKTWFNPDTVADYYSQKYWLESSVYFELWVEKEAITSFVIKVCNRYRIPFFASRGFCSITWLKKNAQAFSERLNRGQTVQLLVFTDLDKHGLMIADKYKEKLEGYIDADLTNFHVDRVGLDLAQVQKYGKTAFMKPDKKTSKPLQGQYEIDCLEDSELQAELEFILQSYFNKYGVAINTVIESEKNEKQRLYSGLQFYKSKLEKVVELLKNYGGD